MKLSAIEFTINLTYFDSTKYTPFFLETDYMPYFIIWNNPEIDDYPAVWTYMYVQKMKYAIISIYNSIIAAWVKQT